MKRASILIVDPHDDTRQILRAYLEFHGYGVLDTPDGEDGLRLAASHSPDLVIGDFRLDATGRSTFSEALRRDAKSEAAVIVFTARTSEEEVEAAGRVGDVVILKPAKPTDVLREVQRLLGHGERANS